MVSYASEKPLLHTEGGQWDSGAYFFTRPLGCEKICCITFPLQIPGIQNKDCQTSATFVFFWTILYFFRKWTGRLNLGCWGGVSLFFDKAMAMETKTDMSFLQFSGWKNISHTANMQEHKVTKKPSPKEMVFMWLKSLTVCVVFSETQPFA